MLTINVRTNAKEVMRGLEQRLQRQIPFAIAKGLTATAKDVQRELTTEMSKDFDRPTPFTQRAIGIAIARKDTLTARVFIKDIQLAYLGIQVDGGTRLPKRRALTLPTDIPLNQYGNIPRRKLQQLLARRDVFSGRVRGVGGIWQRTRKGLKLLVAYQPRAQYRQRFPFYAVAQRTVERVFVPNLRAALDAAIASAR